MKIKCKGQTKRSIWSFYTSHDIFRGLDTSGRFSAMLFKGDNMCDFLFALLCMKTLQKRDQLQKKEFAPKGANSFLLEWTPF